MLADTSEAITEATESLLEGICRKNSLTHDDVVSVIFSVTSDLTAIFPATAARAAGWDAPMLDVQEMHTPEGLAHCIRVLMHVEGTRLVHHVYLRDAERLRPDLADLDHER